MRGKNKLAVTPVKAEWRVFAFIDDREDECHHLSSEMKNTIRYKASRYSRLISRSSAAETSSDIWWISKQLWHFSKQLRIMSFAKRRRKVDYIVEGALIISQPLNCLRFLFSRDSYLTNHKFDARRDEIKTQTTFKKFALLSS